MISMVSLASVVAATFLYIYIAVPKRVRCDRLLTGKGFRAESVPHSTENRYITSPPAFTDEQCEIVEQNFDKLKVEMTKEQVIPFISGERKVGVTFNPGKSPEQQSRWKVGALCNNSQADYEWYFIAVPKRVRCDRLLTGKGFRAESVPHSTENRYIAFDTKTNKVVKIFSGWFDEYGVD